MLRFFLLMLFLAISSFAEAQVVNGDFSAGPANWVWKQATTAGDCVALMNGFSPSVSHDTPTDPFYPNNGRFALLLSSVPQLAAGTWQECRQIEQTLFIPPGTRLSFDARIAYGSGSASLTALIADAGTGSEEVVFTQSSTYRCTINCNSGYGFATFTADISKYWGRNVILKFRGRSSYTRTSLGTTTLDGPVHIDNIKFVPTPIDGYSKPIAGSWYNPNRSGHGIHFSKGTNGDWTLLWYTYLPNGDAVWYTTEAKPLSGGVWQSKLYKSTWNSSTNSNSLTAVGDLRIEITSSKTMNFFWDLYSVNGDNSGYDGGEPFVFLWGGESYTGEWYEPAFPGWGVSVEYKNSSTSIDTVAIVFYYAHGQPVWAQGSVEGTPTGGKLLELTGYTGYGLCPQCVGQTASITAWPAGMLSLSLDAGAGWVDAEQPDGESWRRGSASAPIAIARLTYP